MLPPDNVTILAIDTETHTPKLKTLGPRAIQGDDYAIGISVAAPNGFAAYYPLRHQTGNGPTNIIPWLRDFLAKPEHVAIFAHAKFDVEMLWSLDINVNCRCYDVLAIDALIDENHFDYSLDAVSKRYGLSGKSKREDLERWMIEHGLTMPRNKNKADWGRMREVPPDVINGYATDDALLTLACYRHQKPIIVKQDLGRVAKLEEELIPVTWAMRLEGVPVDLDRAEQLNIQMQAQGNAYLREVRADFPDFEPWAARSLESYVSAFGLVPPRTRTGEPSITNEWLEASDIPEMADLAAYRQAEKMRRDFVSGVVLEMHHKGRVHPSWFSTRGSDYGDDISGTRTGRLACELPNLAQIPKRNKILGPLARSMFVPRAGERWHKADYSSQEPRITLHYAVKYGLPGAKAMAERYYADRTVDYHQIVTDMVNRLTNQPIERDQGKTINLGLVYGLGKDKLAFKLRMVREAVDRLLRTYHRAVPFVKPLQRRSARDANDNGYVTTELGRRRRFNLWEKAGFGPRTKALPKAEASAQYEFIQRAMTYKALNAKVQGTAAEQIKRAMVQLHKENLTPLITLYDELGHSIPEDPVVSKRICSVMENAIELSIPHYVEPLMGSSWDLKK